MNTLGDQVGGNHYKDMHIQPLEFVMENCPEDALKWVFVHNILKYITRDKDSTLEDWKKAKHYMEIYIEYLEDQIVLTGGLNND